MDAKCHLLRILQLYTKGPRRAWRSIMTKDPRTGNRLGVSLSLLGVHHGIYWYIDVSPNMRQVPIEKQCSPLAGTVIRWTIAIGMQCSPHQRGDIGTSFLSWRPGKTEDWSLFTRRQQKVSAVRLLCPVPLIWIRSINWTRKSWTSETWPYHVLCCRTWGSGGHQTAWIYGSAL